MSYISIELDCELIEKAKSVAHVQSRSVAKQIEHWANIGKIAAENPDLSYSLIRELLNTDPE